MFVRSPWFLLFCGVAVVATSIGCFAQASNEDKGVIESDIVVMPEENSRALGWDKGSLAVTIENNDKESIPITVRFSGVHGRSLRSLLIETRDWKIDLMKYVLGVSLPYPNRIILVTGKVGNSGKIGEIGFSMPYMDMSGEQPGRCMTLEIVIINGQVTSNDHLLAQSNRCRQ